MTSKLEFIDIKTQYSILKKSIDTRIHKVLDHGNFIMGPEVRELETCLEIYTGAKNCVTVASGTEALLIALLALGINKGDEVITTPFTFVATAEAIALLGAVPVFVDIQADTYNIDPNLIEAAITSKTKAIIPVSLYGQVADMEEINRIASYYGNIAVIEDAAQSFGATYRNSKSCNLSLIGCTSFFPSKPLGCYGDGGAIFTNDNSLAKIIREIRVHGQEMRYHHTRVGVGGRMDTLQCAIVLAKLDKFPWEIERRIMVGERYLKLLKDILGVQTLDVRNDRNCIWAQFTIQVENRDTVIRGLHSAGVPTSIHYPRPLHKQPAYINICRISGNLTNAELASQRVLSLPMHAYIKRADQEMIVSELRRFVC